MCTGRAKRTSGAARAVDEIAPRVLSFARTVHMRSSRGIAASSHRQLRTDSSAAVALQGSNKGGDAVFCYRMRRKNEAAMLLNVTSFTAVPYVRPLCVQ